MQPTNKNRTRARLTLNKETIRHLGDGELRGAAGGGSGIFACNTNTCTGNCSVPTEDHGHCTVL